jgi:lipid A disaccharide synthetase
MNALTWQIVSRVVKTRHAHLVNVMLQDTAVPEFLQHEAQVELILPKLKELLASREKQAKQKEAFQRVREMLQPDPALSAADQAAEFILKFKTQN